MRTTVLYSRSVPGMRDQRSSNAAYYVNNRRTEISRVRGRQMRTLRFLRELRMVPCTDCGRQFSAEMMDFDHLDPAEKSLRLASGRASLMSRERLLAEAAKCEIACANCHRIRTQTQHRDRLLARSSGKSRYLE